MVFLHVWGNLFSVNESGFDIFCLNDNVLYCMNEGNLFGMSDGNFFSVNEGNKLGWI